ncbi:MAG: PQQ-binding-like beta-propeller repeat protein [Bryobacteraceae bacterium]
MLRSLAVLLTLTALYAEEWNRFRGPNGSGVSADSGFPVEFGKEKNLVWRAPVRPGKSSPVLTETHLFLTGFSGNKLYTQCFERKTGKMIWERGEDKPREETVNKLNHPAAVTPVTDGKNVYSFFKDMGFVAYDETGKLLWKAAQGPYTVSMGLASSPVIAAGNVVLLADQMEGSYIAAFDLRNGELRWKTPREEGEGWGTPLVQGSGDGARIITTSRGQLGVYSASTGKRVATLMGVSPAIVSSPILDGDTVIGFGYGNDEIPPFSVRIAKSDKNGDGKLSADEYGDDAFMRSIAKYGGNRDMVVTEDEWIERQKQILGHNGVMAVKLDGGEPHELWKTNKILNGVIPSALVYQGLVWVVKNGGVLAVFDSATGKLGKEGRIPGAVGGYSSSPVAAGGRVYIANEDGKVAVIKATAEWELETLNDLGEPVFATPALSKGEIYLRTNDALYCFATKGK